MKRNPGLLLVLAGLALPLVWLFATADLTASLAGGVGLLGALATYLWLGGVLWRAHRAGRFAPHRCRTCDHPMLALAPGALRPPRATTPVPLHRWVCRHCGRLV